jgi:hypothetical protein
MSAIYINLAGSESRVGRRRPPEAVGLRLTSRSVQTTPLKPLHAEAAACAAPQPPP